MALAAGEGSRFRPHTSKVPKPALPFLNVPMAFYSLAALSEINPTRLVVNAFHLEQQIRDLFRSMDEKSHSINEVHVRSDGAKILGSAGGLKNCQNLFLGEENIILFNADEVFLPAYYGQFEKFLEFHQREKNLASLMVMEHPEVGSKFGGVWADDKKTVQDIGMATTKGPLAGYHFIGLSILSRRIFDFIPEGAEQNIFYDTLKPLLHEGQVKIFPFEGAWYETGNLKSYLKATEACLQHMKSNDAAGKHLERVLSQFSPQTELFETEGGGLLLSTKSIYHQTENTGSKVSHFAVIDPIHHLLEACKFDRAVLGPGFRLHELGPDALQGRTPSRVFENNLYL
jgi:mannose-1-phosphate guanylyltransferase